ncbi:MAG: rod shape-determining protein MreD [Thiobacillaceae bacterium]|jgi:rod shape-determining protein MreD|nr:rod shape-determining protein MreD [Thiobacillaceae bacterium]
MKREKSLAPRGPQLAAPAGAALVIGSIAFAFLLGLLPWPVGWHWLVPDFAFLVLLYWNINEPHRAGLGVAFLLGLLVDAAQGVLFGLHALVYVIAAYLALSLRRRLEKFSPAAQALQLGPVFVGKEALVLLVGLAFGRIAIDWGELASGLLATLLWIPACLLFGRLGGRPVSVQASAGEEK